MKKVLVLGSTGSIGVNSLKVIKELSEDFSIAGLAVNRSIDLLYKQILAHKPEFVIITNTKAYKDFKEKYDCKCDVLHGYEELINAAKEKEYDILIGSMVGFSGLAPTIEAVKRGKRIALANKETLVAAGDLVMNLCKEHNSEIIPVDSEHSAIFQCLQGEKHNEVEKIILTASGGPFLNYTKEQLCSVSIEQALNHPNWKMGNKVTIDSASMMNKGLEVIEAKRLFDVDTDQIDVVIHPQSIIHSMVQFVDSSVKAQLGVPDMKMPIQYALTYPERKKSSIKRVNFPKIENLTFFEPDFNKFECLKLAFDALNTGGLSTCILNAANEIAVEKFLTKQISFNQIPVLISKALNKIENSFNATLEDIFICDKLTREFVTELN